MRRPRSAPAAEAQAVSLQALESPEVYGPLRPTSQQRGAED